MHLMDATGVMHHDWSPRMQGQPACLEACPCVLLRTRSHRHATIRPCPAPRCPGAVMRIPHLPAAQHSDPPHPRHAARRRWAGTPEAAPPPRTRCAPRQSCRRPARAGRAPRGGPWSRRLQTHLPAPQPRHLGRMQRYAPLAQLGCSPRDRRGWRCRCTETPVRVRRLGMRPRGRTASTSAGCPAAAGWPPRPACAHAGRALLTLQDLGDSHQPVSCNAHCSTSCLTCQQGLSVICQGAHQDGFRRRALVGLPYDGSGQQRGRSKRAARRTPRWASTLVQGSRDCLFELAAAQSKHASCRRVDRGTAGSQGHMTRK